MNTIKNPYVGPRAFEPDETLYGRERELAQLESLLIAERLVLLHSPSGAGKTSLIQAGLVPSLRGQDFNVPPVIRVNLEPPVELIGLDGFNRYTFSVLASLEEGQPPEARLPDAELVALGLDAYLERHFPVENDLALVFDQFEEVLTASPADRDAKQAFFNDLGLALRREERWALFAMREDYLGALAPYLRPIPGQFKNRYRLDLLGPDAAQQAIQKPAQSTGIEFSDEIARKLIDDLRVIQVQQPDGSFEHVPGQNIEPVQLQVVCYNLWQSGAADDGQITLDDLQKVGSVDDALAAYYTESIQRASEHRDVNERAIRQWFSEQLITPDGIRSQALRGHESTAGLDNRVIQQFVDAHLVRGETRAGKTWYELAHDRLVEPVRKSNNTWFDKNLSLLQKQAKLWVEQGRGDGLLLRGEALKDAEKETTAKKLNDAEQDFLEACKKLREREQRDRRQRQFIVAGLVASLVLMMVSIVLAVTANNAKQQADQNARIARAGELALLSEKQRDKDLLISSLLGVEAFRTFDTLRTRGALLDNLVSKPYLDRYLFGHSDWVYSVAFSPDGKILASSSCAQMNESTACIQGEIILWNVETGAPIGELLKGHIDSVSSMAFSPDGKILASGSYDGTIILWDMTKYQPIGQPLKSFARDVSNVAFSPDGKILASSSYDGTIILWNVATGETIGEPLKKHLGAVYSVAFSPNGKFLASGGEDGTIILWDVATHQFIRQFTEHTASVFSVAFSPECDNQVEGCGKTLLSGSYDGTIILWNVLTGEPIKKFIGHTDPVLSIAISLECDSQLKRCGEILASGSSDGTIILWDVETGKSIGDPLKEHEYYVSSVVFSPASPLSGGILASGSYDGSIILWDVSSAINRDGATTRLIENSFHGHMKKVRSVAFSPECDSPPGGCGKILASGSNDGTIILWNVETGEFIGNPLRGHTDEVRSVAFSPDGKILASGSNDGTIILWDVATGETIRQLVVGSTNYVLSVAFSPNGLILASGSSDGTIMLWNVETGQPIGKPLEGMDSVFSLAFSPDGKILASGGCAKVHENEDCPQGEIILWDVKTSMPIADPLKEHTGIVASVAFSPDGKTLASGSLDKTIILWDVETARRIIRLEGHTDYVRSVAFSPECDSPPNGCGKTLASGSYDGTIILWDVETGQLIGKPLKGYTGEVRSVAFSPDGKLLASGSSDNSIILWDVSTVSWAEKACRLVGRNFTRAEWELYGFTEPYRATCSQWPIEAAPTVISTP